MFNYRKILFGLSAVFLMNQCSADITLYNETDGDVSIQLFDKSGPSDSIKINAKEFYVISDADTNKTVAISIWERSFSFNEELTRLHNGVTYNIKTYIEESECAQQMRNGMMPPFARRLDFGSAEEENREQPDFFPGSEQPDDHDQEDSEQRRSSPSSFGASVVCQLIGSDTHELLQEKPIPLHRRRR